jgi:PAS domain S-box-containing protein/putative nucleotidyltransferase with HDIG domain
MFRNEATLQSDNRAVKIKSTSPSARRKLGQIWDRLSEPHASLQKPEQRRRARLLSSVVLVLLPTGAIAFLLTQIFRGSVSAEWVVAAFCSLIAIAYVLSRTRHYRVAIFLMIATLVVCVVLSTIGARNSDILYYLVFAILLGGVFLSPLATALVAAATATTVLCLPLVVAPFPSTNVILLGFLILMTGAMATVVALRQQQDIAHIEQQSQDLAADYISLQASQQALGASEAQLSNILENAAEAIMALDADQRIVVFNAGAEKVFGFSEAEVLGQSLSLLLPERLAKAHRDQVQAFGSQQPAGRPMAHRAQVTGRRKDGIEFPAEVGISSYLENGQTVYTAVLIDITQRKQHEQEIEVVASVSAALRQAQTRAGMLPIVLDQLCALLHAAGSGIAMRDSATGDNVIELGRGSWAAVTGERLSAGFGLPGTVIASGRMYWNNHVRDDPQVARPDLLEKIQAIAAVPLIAQDQTFGALWIGKDLPITPTEVSLLTAIADIAANAIHRATLHEQTERHLKRHIVLRSIDLAISSSLDLSLILNVLVEEITTRLAMDAADVLLVNPYRPILEYAAGRGFRTRGVTRTSMRLGEGLAGAVALNRQFMHVPQLRDARAAMAQASRLDGEDFVSYYAAPLIAAAQVVGVLEVFQRSQADPDPDWSDFLEGLALQAANAIEKARLYDRLQVSTIQLAAAYDATIEGWSRALDLRDHETEGHTERVTELAMRLARELKIDDEQLVHIRRGALLHDIGKMAVPDLILLKPGPLTEQETEIMRQHPTTAYRLLAPIAYLKPALDIPYCHHEKWDGTGYPRGLAGDEIPLAARIFAVADVWDALCSDRPYRAAWPVEKVHEYILAQAGIHFDPQVVAVFLEQNSADRTVLASPVPARYQTSRSPAAVQF